jgi:two-component system, chemotaxis family, response regulator Rcp1
METLSNKIRRSIYVLLVEDNLGDATLISEAFKSSKKPILIARVKDGEEALQYLRREGCYDQAFRPDLILLDLNMPKKSGLEVLDEIKSDPKFSEIPVVILTNSKLESDVKKAYETRANYYMIKPSNLDQLFESMRYVEDVWLRSVDSPED